MGHTLAILARAADRSSANTFERVGTHDWWFFGESLAEGRRFAHLRLFHAASVRIMRCATVKSELNPYDPGWASYLDQRSRRRSTPTVSTPWALEKAEPCELEILMHGP